MPMQAHKEDGGVGPTHPQPRGWRGWVVSATPRPLYPPRKTRYSLCRRMGGSRGPVWTRTENAAPKLVWFSDRPARSEPLCWLRFYFGFMKIKCSFLISGTLSPSASPPPHPAAVAAAAQELRRRHICNGWPTTVFRTSCLCSWYISVPNFTCLVSAIINYLHPTES
jgi:hypothetical protein